MGPEAEGAGPSNFHPQYEEGEGAYDGTTRPVRGGSIDMLDVMRRAGVCLNLQADNNEGKKNGGRNEENSGTVEEDNPGEARWPTGGKDTGSHTVSSARGLPVGDINGRSPSSETKMTTNTEVR
jgi:hypothetical protein